jgi:hypothetical protein
MVGLSYGHTGGGLRNVNAGQFDLLAQDGCPKLPMAPLTNLNSGGQRWATCLLGWGCC